MLVTGLALALSMIVAVQFFQGLGNVENAQPINEQTSRQQDINQTVTPVIFQSMSEQNDTFFVSGTSGPDANIGLYHGTQKLAEVQADKDGFWETSIAVAADKYLKIDLSVDVEDGAKIRSDETLYRIPSPVDISQENQLASPSLIIVTAPGGPTRIIQSPFRGLPTADGLTVGAVDYDKSGGVIFSGSAALEGNVRIYANDKFIGESQIGPDGRWFLIAAETLPLGSYDLEAELIVNNSINSELSIPFERLKDAEGFEMLEESLYVKYLPFGWQVARSLLGGGLQFTVILAPLEADALIVDN